MEFKRPTSNFYSVLGLGVVGETALNQPLGTGFHLDNAVSTKRLRAQNGFLTFGRRSYSKGEVLILPLRTAPKEESASISITSRTGVLVGRLRTDSQRTIISEVSFSDVGGSSGECTLKLTRLPC